MKRQDQYITKTVIREEIKLKSVPYYGMIDQTTGYLKFTSFTRGASEEVLQGF
ncbi:MAG: hypothetical protein IPM74_17915 [Crocinitomicaceae bacterium]|nr:hypothetical protein [Crocinitomicaceae bacterium]